MTRNSSTSSSSVKLIAPAFLWVVGIILLLEILGRTFFVQNLSGRFEYGYHPTAGFVEQGDTLQLVRSGGRRFHPQTLKIEKPEGLLRVFVVGDSVPRGPSLQGAYAYQLQEMLKQQGVNAEVLNMAIPGFGARRIQILVRTALKYKPDLVVFHLNDSSEFEDEREWRRASEFKSWHPQNWLMKSFILRRLYEMKTEGLFWKKLPEAVRAKSGVSDADTELKARQDDEVISRWHQRLYQTNEQTLKLLYEKDIPVVILVQTSYLKEKGGLQRVTHLEKFAEQMARNANVYWLAMADSIESDKADELFSDPTHMRSEGHKQLARGILKLLVEKKLVPVN